MIKKIADAFSLFEAVLILRAVNNCYASRSVAILFFGNKFIANIALHVGNLSLIFLHFSLK